MKPIYLVVTPFFPSPNNWRGAYCYDFVVALMRDGRYDVRVFVPEKGEDYEYQGVHVSRFPIVKLPSGLFPCLFAMYNSWSFIRKVRKVGIDVNECAICHGHTMDCAIYPLAVNKINRSILTLVHHHNSEPIRLNAGRFGRIPLYSDMMYLWLRSLSESIDCHVFCSKKSRDTFCRYCVTVPEGIWADVRTMCIWGKWFRSFHSPRALICYNGFDPVVFRNNHISHRGFVIGCIANFQPYKGQIVLLQAIEKLKDRISDINLRLIGSGETFLTCQAYVSEHRLSSIVSFHDEIDHSELPSFYNSLDLFVLPSRMEGFCCVYMESYGCGIPFIGCKGVSCEEVISECERDIWLAEPNDAESLAEKIYRFWERRNEQHLMRKMDYGSIISDFLSDVNVICQSRNEKSNS